jgi:hypothetical protein
MNQLTRNGLGLAAATLALAAFAAPSLAADAWLGRAQDKDVYLSYGATPPAGEAPNPETIQLNLGCTKGSGVVKIFVAESSTALVPGRTVQLTLAAAGIVTSVQAKVLPNQLAGVPSLQATLPAGSAVFDVLARLGRAGRGTLRLTAAAWSARFPLETMGLQADSFFRACGPKAR